MTDTTDAPTALAVVGNQEFAILKAEPGKLPALIKDNLGDDNLSAFDLDRIKIPAGGGTAYEVPSLDGETMEKDFAGVIIYHKGGRVYWAEEFTGQGNPPDCASEDCITGFGNPGGECSQCPFGRFGSDPKGGKGQACKQLKQLFVMRPGDLLPVVVTLPPTSLGAARKFLLRLANNGLPFYAVLVRFSLEKTKNSNGIEYSRVVLSVAERLSPEQAERFKEIRDSLKPHLEQVSVGSDDYVTDEEPAEAAV